MPLTITLNFMIENILKKIGLNEKEINVYLTCLKLGPAPVRKIASEAGVNRGTAYDILRALANLQLIAYYHKDKHQYFMAEDPTKINEVIDEKQKQLISTKKEINGIMPELLSRYNKAGAKPVVKYYEGERGIKFILRDVITSTAQTAGEYYVFSSSTIKKYIYAAYPNFSAERVKARVKVKTISIGAGGETYGLDARKWLTKNESAPTYTLIYVGKVAMITVNQSVRPLGVIIEDDHIYQTEKMIFDALWKFLK